MAQDLNKHRVLGVLAGRDLSSERIAAWARSAEFVLAADGGANILFESGIVPDVAVGDFDSIEESTKGAQSRLVHAPSQDTSDGDKLLAYALECGIRRITLCGIEGDLIDHLLGTLQSAARSPLEIRFVLRRGVAKVLKGPIEMSLDLPLGTRLSLMPVTTCSIRDLQGVVWPLVDVELSPVGLVSLSNRVSGPVRISLASGIAGLFLSHPTLEIPHWPE